MKGNKKILAAVLIIVMVLGLFMVAQAAQTDFPLEHLGNMVADEGTRYITQITQDPQTKMITALVQVQNNTTRGRDIMFSSLGVEISFDDRVGPYKPSEDRIYHGGVTSGEGALTGYYKTYTEIDDFSPEGMRNDSTARMIGAKIATINDATFVYVRPGETLNIVEFYFMPENRSDALDPSMFSFEYKTLGVFKCSTAIFVHTAYLVADERYPSSMDDYVLSPGSFKMHVKLPAPTNLAADQDSRTVTNYDPSTMEWSASQSGPYSNGAILIGDEDQTIYVRMQGSDYYDTSGAYVDYKKNLPSDPVEITFDSVFYSAKDDVSLTKTSENKTPTDGKTHVGDTLEYTVTAKNDGHVKSVWADAVMTDVLDEGVTFVNDSVTINGTPAGAAASYDEASRTLTVDLGDIPGNTQKEVKFQVTVNEKAYNKLIKNSVTVNGKDGEGGEDLIRETEETGGGHNVPDLSKSPDINPITEGDGKITGKGEIGAEIVVTFPGGGTATATVDENGNWEVDAPPTLKTGDDVSAVQTETGKDTSKPTTETVGGRPPSDLSIVKTYENKTSTDGKNRVNDTIEYTITVANNGDSKSLVVGAVVTDELPEAVTLKDGSVMIGTAPAGSAAVYDGDTLTVTLGDLKGGESKVITFQVTINDDAYGADIKNSATVNAKDGGSDEDIDDKDDDDNTEPVFGKSAMPTIDEVNVGDRIITGTGVPGAEITVTLPGGGMTVTTKVKDDKTWEIDVPKSINLVEGDTVKAVQTEEDMDPSDPAAAIVQQKPPVVPSMSKISENLTSTDGKTRVGDRLKYTITVGNVGSPKSLWVGVSLTDPIPDGITLDRDSVLLDGKVPTYSFYNTSTRTLIVSMGDIAGGETKVVTFEATVNTDAYGKTILNSAAVDGKDDGSGDNVHDETEEDGGRDIPNKSKEPTVNDVTRGDDTISGEGIPGAEIVVKLPDGTPLTTEVNGDKTWSVDVPADKELKEKEVIEVIQIEPDKDPSDKVTTVVKDKAYRAVTGLVSPHVSIDPGVGGDFLAKHEIVVELRATFNTPASSSLRTTAVVTTVRGQGRFTIENVPFGTYVLYIDRAGYLIRSMTVTISASDPDEIELSPPGSETVFNLWWGDVNKDLVVDASDISYVVAMKNVDAFNARYLAACDFNADGAIDASDINYVLMNKNKTAMDYPGAENIDFFS